MAVKDWCSLFLRNPRVLVVDDDETLAEVTAKIFSDGGAQVRVATDGNKGLVEANQFHPDLIIADVAMPYLRGDEMLVSMRKAGYEKPFILLTGFADLDHVVEALRQDVFDFLIKPVSRKLLIAVAQNALRAEQRRLTQAAEVLEFHEALAGRAPPSGFASWPEAIRERARERVQTQRQDSEEPHGTQ